MSIEVNKLTFAFSEQAPLSLHDVSLSLPPGSRAVLVGANGAGKTTLLRVLAGKRLAKAGAVSVNGVDPFRTGVAGITYLGTEWAENPVVRNDVSVPYLLKSVGGDTYAERRDMLVRMLDIDLRWHMHAVSDGERRRVQLCMGLLKPWQFLFLDEVTADLDVLARMDLLDFLKAETEERGAVVCYATHIFDGLAEWPTHLVHMSLGQVLDSGKMADFMPQDPSAARSALMANSSLLTLALDWLKRDRQVRGAREQEKRPKWEEVMSESKTEASVFTKYYKMSRGM